MVAEWLKTRRRAIERWRLYRDRQVRRCRGGVRTPASLLPAFLIQAGGPGRWQIRKNHLPCGLPSSYENFYLLLRPVYEQKKRGIFSVWNSPAMSIPHFFFHRLTIYHLTTTPAAAYPVFHQ